MEKQKTIPYKIQPAISIALPPFIFFYYRQILQVYRY
jgi:hypothetical protein